MKRFRYPLLVLATSVFTGIPSIKASINEFDRSLDQLKEKLIFESNSGDWYFEPTLQGDLWYYHIDTPTEFVGFWFPEPGEHSNVSPRLTLFGDLYYREIAEFSFKARIDDGVHPGVAHYYGDDYEQRIDELYLRLKLDPKFNFQIGQYTPLFGNFLSRQNSWDMGLINYPITYETVNVITDDRYPTGNAHFAGRKNAPINPLIWIPTVWAPLYTRGASIYGDFGKITYAINVMNHGIASRGIMWNDTEFDYPTIASNVSYRGSAAWKVGFNLSQGTYLRHSDPNLVLPPGTDFDDFKQTTAGIDFQYAHGDLELWAEAFWTQYGVPNLTEYVSYVSYYIEGKYQLMTKVWLSARWNQELYDEIQVGSGSEDWNHDLWRADFGVGYRFSRHAQIKTQYTYQEREGNVSWGKELFATELTFRF